MNNIPNKIQAILSALGKLNRKLDLIVSSGLDPNEISHTLFDLEIDIPKEVYSLYETINGSKYTDKQKLKDIQIFPGYYLLPLDEAVENYKLFLKDKRWNRFWFPLFANGGGDFYAIKCDIDEKESGKILGFILDGPESEVEYSSLENMLSVVLECFIQNAFYVDIEGVLKIDYSKRKEIARSFNPNLPRWK